MAQQAQERVRMSCVQEDRAFSTRSTSHQGSFAGLSMEKCKEFQDHDQGNDQDAGRA